MKRWLILSLVILMFILPVSCTSNTTAAITSVTPQPSTKPPVTAPPASKPAAAVTANTTATTKVNTISADGRLAFVQDIKLTFGTYGKITKINVREMDSVSKGQELAKLDTVTLEQAIKTAEFAVTSSELTLKSAQSDRVVAENAIKSAESDLKTAQQNAKSAGIDLDQATDNFRKITYPYEYITSVFDVPQAIGFMHDASLQVTDAANKIKPGMTATEIDTVASQLRKALENLDNGIQLLNRGEGTDVFQSQTLPMRDFWTLRTAQLQMEKSKVALENAQNTVVKSGVTLDNSRAALIKSQIAVDKASNDFDKAKNDLEKAKDELQKATIISPISGVVAKIYLKESDSLTSTNYSSTTVIEIIDPAQMQLDVKVNELDIANVKVGQKVTINVDAQRSLKISTVIAAIGSLPLVESGVVSYEVRVIFDVPAGSALKAGMRASVQISQ